MRTYDLCTVVDAGYLARGLALYRSLEAQHVGVRLRVLCMDATSAGLLRRLALPGVELLILDELEQSDPALGAIKGTRTLVEYCWTLKPSLIRHIFKRESELGEVTYVDADHLFWDDPAPAYAELGDGSALIVPQRSGNDDAGRYNAGFVVFRRGEETDEILGWWRERCLEWSFAGVGGGNRRYGDQGYLGDWPERYPGVRVLAHPGGGLAPWNYDRSRLGLEDGVVTVDGAPLLFFHHQSLRLYRGLRPAYRLRLLGDRFRLQAQPVPVVWAIGRWYSFSDEQRTLLWEPSAARLSTALAELRAVEPGFAGGLQRLPRRELAREIGRAVVPASGRRAARRITRALRPTSPLDGT